MLDIVMIFLEYSLNCYLCQNNKQPGKSMHYEVFILNIFLLQNMLSSKKIVKLEHQRDI